MSHTAENIIRLLLVEDNPGDAELIQEVLRDASGPSFVVTRAEQLQEAVERAQSAHFDLVVLDLSLPDCYGLDTVITARDQIPDLPIVVLTGATDEMLGMEAVQSGAQDYLIKGQMADGQLTRALHYALTRHTMQERIKAAAMTDELTGLNNRRGFLMLAGQQRKLAKRTNVAFLLLYADIDKFKWINDTLGHQEGDCALLETAGILRKTFRASDVIARLGGDEFVVAALEEDTMSARALETRLQMSLDLRNALPDCSYPLVMSAGVIRCAPENEHSTEELLADADAAMYAQKREK